MTLDQIKENVNKGVNVFWQNSFYKVVKSGNDYLIKGGNGHCIGLTWSDGITLNGKNDEFFCFEPDQCLIIKVDVDTELMLSVNNLLESHEIISDFFDTEKNEICFSLSELHKCDISVYSIIEILEQNKINNVNFTIEKRLLC